MGVLIIKIMCIAIMVMCILLLLIIKYDVELYNHIIMYSKLSIKLMKLEMIKALIGLRISFIDIKLAVMIGIYKIIYREKPDENNDRRYKVDNGDNNI